MILNEPDVMRHITKPVRGIVHVGAHEAQELSFYRRRFGSDVPVCWVEGDPDVYPRLLEAIHDDVPSFAVNAVVSDEHDRVMTFNRANMDQSSSLLQLGTHKEVHPEVHYVDTIEVHTTTLDLINEDLDLYEFNFLNMDVQGAEGLVILGATEYLKGVDYIYTEINRDELYSGCWNIEEMDNELGKRGFDRKEIFVFDHLGWGDAFYVRRGV